MRHYIKIAFYLLTAAIILVSCKANIRQQEDKIYSRHLQEHLTLSIISTPMPDDKSKMNLLILNDGQDLSKLRVKSIVDSLYRKGLIQPLVVVAVHANDRMREYGVAGSPDYKSNGSRADKYSAFIDNELYDFIKKRSGVRKFNSVTIAGCSLGGLSAFDIAWNNADKIDKAGMFSGSFWWRDKDADAKDYSDENNRIMLNKIKSSRKKPKVKYWFYAGAMEETGDRDKDGIIDVVDDTRDLINIIKNKNVIPSSDIIYTEATNGTHDYGSWSNAFPTFLLWAVGK
ncbi:MAG: alpha/beta hydrolase-fold protein [Ferruginibacter sp.]